MSKWILYVFISVVVVGIIQQNQHTDFEYLGCYEADLSFGRDRLCIESDRTFTQHLVVSQFEICVI